MLWFCLVSVVFLTTPGPDQDGVWNKQMQAGEAALDQGRLAEAEQAFAAALPATET